ncbi:MAG: 4'-phosphopantetheinyl transferase superfamily protein [Xanthomonadales bacterium]|mgnify:FL=1|nr:4'-phosphopantetheinyl transferase superfamily protein [Pseudoxanthomonas sp.]MDZ3798381.1 4'-phosphopantetheinyl transferase superfamily protein [Xanthomonadales bacterium]MBP8740639.1 4'-phosphopantetheinyl transferase superfamily protein [Pseudoxanthomonas sp.]MBP8804022.1 4'-phosphopantetheinyl transferase superfamily protein [Pseudoxanthomonas sp.]MBP9536417.1 4'-phosphopantetheinyl transferase superfamily protein [Pseudoxanthomonas sp.]
MGAASTPTRQWRYGPIQVASLPYLPGQRGEPQVRDTLARWLGEPGPPPLARDPSGRPRLLAPHQDHDTGWSHSGEQLLLALGRGVTLGVDLERLRPRPRALELADRFFAPGEAGRLQALAPERRELAFLRLWCAKEAVLKAHGQGLSFGLHRLEFIPDGDDEHAPLRLLASDPELGAASDWQLHEWIPAPGYLAALAWHPR